MNKVSWVKAFPLVVLVSGGLAASAFGYGSEGHQIVGAIADHLLVGTHAEQHVHALLGAEKLEEVATWPDKIRNGPMGDPDMDHFLETHRKMVEGRPEHTLFHFADIPIQETHYSELSVGASNHDIVHAMEDCILGLEGKKPLDPWFQNVPPRVDLILLTHYVGDIHQPLHVGAAYISRDHQFVNPNTTSGAESDEGGNLLIYRSFNLHSFWDTAAVKGAIRKEGFRNHPLEFAEYTAQNPPQVALTPGDPVTWPTHWATEILPIARQAHEGITIMGPLETHTRSGEKPAWAVELPPDYYDFAEATVAAELARGGVRLSQLLEAIWP